MLMCHVAMILGHSKTMIHTECVFKSRVMLQKTRHINHVILKHVYIGKKTTTEKQCSEMKTVAYLGYWGP